MGYSPQGCKESDTTEFLFLVHLHLREICKVWILQYSSASLVAQMVKNPPAKRETWVRSLGWEDPLEEGMATHSSILPGEFHGQRSLGDYNQWGHKESDTT